jgi:YidC/Oxa1 family membrane protein insertase
LQLHNDRKYPLPEIRNPNLQTPGAGGGSGGDMRSTMTFALLMIVVLLGYQFFFKPKPDETQPATQTQSQTNQPPGPAGQAAPTGSQPGPSQPPAASPTGQSQAPAPTVAAALETETTVENEQYKIVFTNRGAQIAHWILKKYNDSAGKPLDMVQPQAAARFGFPLSFFTYEPALNTQLNQALYQVTASGAQPSATGHALAPETNALTFHYAANGVDAVKTVRFDTSYVITVEAQVRRNGAPVRALVQWPSGLGDMEEFLPSSLTRSAIRTSALSQFAWSIDGKQSSMSPTPSGFLFWTQPEVSGYATFNQPYQYAAIADLYFVSAFMPENPEGATLVTLHNTIDLPGDLSDPNSQKKPAHVLGLAVGDTSGYTRLRLYAGPKSMDVLTSIHTTGADGKPNGQSLEPLIQFGWLTIIAKPLYLALRYLVEHGIDNWGWSIIVVTVIFNLLMLPTRFMMMKSSLKMMRLQPKADAIKQRYAHLKTTDPKKAEMNNEIMELYKSENVNMYGSCLPMLIQMPLFFAYFRVLQNTVELRQAHWYWLSDLSSPDPIHILPILIIITMFLTQYITPSPGMDPAQRRMMAFMMPVMFGFMLWHYASGLALYWGTGNIINLFIQLGINQSSIGKEMHEISARRAAKRAGRNPRSNEGRK